MSATNGISSGSITVGQGAEAREIAWKRRGAAGKGPALVWLGGYKSDMEGTKALALDAFAAEKGFEAIRFDYSGHGISGGAFSDGTISRWLEESLAVISRFAPEEVILVGSSMGGWIALRAVQEILARGLPVRVKGLVLIAPAPDFTVELIEPALSEAEKHALETLGYFEEPSEYGPEPYIYTRGLIEDGRKNRVLDGLIATGCPVHILQGMRDTSVPYAHALKLMEHLPADDVVLTLIRDGDHRLSRPQDIERLKAALCEIARA
ncbi:alpha/beta hydrolase [Rhizobiaceae bacterium BDR2-2]|uniref:Palmitoyl-protein thioesterase ABHD10, mitochondrial n=1 Tax=Ectorhizobium quercum TaxID=2965071 RepID=A0AAE3N2C0_9HYPH|nr:alpha/beta hydrolase [Ectorhizobium quercum]MCX8997995.1 alpha/beta hydrolase [Ectorhizobium quercum]